MKKLFFTALVALVAISGAHATSLWLSGNWYPTPDFICEGGIPDCSIKNGGDVFIYEMPGGAGWQGPGKMLSEYSFQL
ncbi:hypothetical protein FBD94_08250 [Pedobacter hiemivivus]|uniref:Uncharacterized protein n=1 Tax=Pedobacter hiemivivus TaxID=2530454 RepID=A0A4U1GH43_9SPHI|nr:hypothetical protein [Pedobacter hiemivivus]TKC62203.1 hypothetical protein FBD94_08250 [Pedobacter hiemivivus]